MKKILFIIAFTILCSNNIAIAQTESTDGFFTYSENYNIIRRYSSSITPVLPYEHELIGKQSADSSVPTGSGLLILTGIGICYAAHKKKSLNLSDFLFCFTIKFYNFAFR